MPVVGQPAAASTASTSSSGDWYHTARWPQDGVELAGKRVGIIGTGSTGIQLIPQLAKHARHLHVFQRTANFSMPAHNAPLDREVQRTIKAAYGERRRLPRESLSGVPRSHPDAVPQRSALEVTPQEREADLRARLGGGRDRRRPARVQRHQRQRRGQPARPPTSCARRSARSSDDPATAEALCPTTHPIGTKRICVDIDYYATYNRDNVTLVDVRSDPIDRRHTRAGSRRASAEYELDVLVFATGFDAITGALLDIDIRGREGRTLRDKWSEGPRTYLGLAAAGFPNMFLVTGPGSPSVLSNMVCSIEQHIDWIADCIGYLRDRELRHDRGDARRPRTSWVAHVAEVAEMTLFPRANSWYVGANIPGKPRVFMPYLGGVGAYRTHCDARGPERL